MSMNIFGTKLQQGRHYMTLWPRRPELNSMFPENRVIKATEFALKMMGGGDSVVRMRLARPTPSSMGMDRSVSTRSKRGVPR